MPEHDDLPLLDPPFTAGGAPAVWYRRVPVASALFAVGLAALLTSVLVARPAGRTDHADGADAGISSTPATFSTDSPTPTTAAGSAPEVLGEQQTSNRVAISAALIADAVTTPLTSTAEAVIAEGAIHASWRITDVPANIGATRGFVSISVDIAAGAVSFAPSAPAVIEIRCVRGACADWRSWTALPVGIVTEQSATTLVPRGDFVGIEAFAVRTVRDPRSYTTP